MSNCEMAASAIVSNFDWPRNSHMSGSCQFLKSASLIESNSNRNRISGGVSWRGCAGCIDDLELRLSPLLLTTKHLTSAEKTDGPRISVNIQFEMR